ncbi:MAG: hypothetical protein GC159_00730 [Phycisphaera sp.]|nr:hypothetical protein [Phycisphaera sp.]
MKRSVAIVLGLFLIGGCDAGSAPTKPTALPADPDRLVDQLASTNKPPGVDDFDLPVYAPGFDAADTERVERVRQALCERGVDAIPSLIDHADDDRYSQTVTDSTTVNRTVGRNCVIALSRIVDGDLLREKSPYSVFSTSVIWHAYRDGNLEEWWSKRSTWSLRQIQIDALEWRIEKVREIGFVGDWSESQAVGPLQRRLDQLKSAQDTPQ